jgi:hypothetical protein
MDKNQLREVLSSMAHESFITSELQDLSLH